MSPIRRRLYSCLQARDRWRMLSRAADWAADWKGWVRTVLCCALLVGGCGSSEELETAYGRRLGRGGSSVNGTSVLADMFREFGCRAVTVNYLSRRLEKYDAVVWAPNDFSLPGEEAAKFLEGWLAREPDRTLVFVGRDYDAACDYWQALVRQSPAQQKYEVMRRAARARAAHSHDRVQMPHEACCEWFVMRRDHPGRRLRQLSGPWSAEIDLPQTSLWSQGRLDIPAEHELLDYWKNTPPPADQQPEYTPLLTSGQETVVFRMSKASWAGSRILVVANGSFLLNLPLVNHQHRLLAGRVIDACRPAEAVAFLETDAGGPLVMDREDKGNVEGRRARTLLAAHWFFLGALFCFAVLPIFGRPRTVESETAADFGQHVEALGSLLERTGDCAYARRQLDLYHHASDSETRRGRGASELPSGPAAAGGLRTAVQDMESR